MRSPGRLGELWHSQRRRFRPLARSSSRELLECPGLSSVAGRTVDTAAGGGAAAGAAARAEAEAGGGCRGEGCGVDPVVGVAASGAFLATGVTRCCCDGLRAFSFSFSASVADSFSFSLALALEEEPPIERSTREV